MGGGGGEGGFVFIYLFVISDRGGSDEAVQVWQPYSSLLLPLTSGEMCLLMCHFP